LVLKSQPAPCSTLNAVHAVNAYAVDGHSEDLESIWPPSGFGASDPPRLRFGAAAVSLQAALMAVAADVRPGEDLSGVGERPSAGQSSSQAGQTRGVALQPN